MGPPISVDRSRGDRFGFVDFGARRDLVVIREGGAGSARYDLVAGRAVHEVTWDLPLFPVSQQAVPLAEARRLDGDEEADSLWCGEAGTVAISGRTGQPLWTANLDDGSQLVGPASWIRDINNDGFVDFVWLARDRSSGWVEARSGGDGRPLWRADLPAPPESVPLVVVEVAGRVVVLAMADARLVALEPLTGRPAFGPVPLRFEPTSPPRATDRDGDGRADHLFVFGDYDCRLFDGRDGAEVGAGWYWTERRIDVPRWLDADRLLHLGGRGSGGDGMTLAVGSNGTGAAIWRHPEPGSRSEADPCPLIDINGDGCLDPIVVRRVFRPPTARASVAAPGLFQITPPPVTVESATIVARDGTTGDVLWSKPMPARPFDGWSTVAPAAVGPDLDGDHVAELFAASIGGASLAPSVPAGVRHSLFIEAISGATGETLWWQRRELAPGRSMRQLLWCSRGPGHPPALVVRNDTTNPSTPFRPEPSRVWVLRAEDGAPLRTLVGDHAPSALDLDKDGIDELVFVPSPEQATGRIVADRGHPPEGKSSPRADPRGDPRRGRVLPWADAATISYAIGSMLAALVLLALPAYVGARGVRTRSLRWLVVGVATVALWMAAVRQGFATAEVDEELLAPQWQAARLLDPVLAPLQRVNIGTLGPRELRVAVGLPFVGALLACWGWRRRWRRLILAWVVCSAAIALAWWLDDRQLLEPGESYRPQRWSWIGFWGAGVLGAAGILRWLTFGAWLPTKAPRGGTPEAAS